MHPGVPGKLTAAAQALYQRLPSAAEAEALGFDLEDFTAEACDVWPENWPAVQLFLRLSTQWLVGPTGGPTGLLYPALYPLLDRIATDAAEWDQLFDDVQHLERAALSELQKKAD